LYLDAGRVRQLLVVFLSNALKFSKQPGEVELMMQRAEDKDELRRRGLPDRRGDTHSSFSSGGRVAKGHSSKALSNGRRRPSAASVELQRVTIDGVASSSSSSGIKGALHPLSITRFLDGVDCSPPQIPLRPDAAVSAAPASSAASSQAAEPNGVDELSPSPPPASTSLLHGNGKLPPIPRSTGPGRGHARAVEPDEEEGEEVQAEDHDSFAHYDGPFLLLGVRDSGPGFPRSAQSLLWRPFTQLDASTTRAFQGTGLGLVIARRLSEAMGGRAWAVSEEGKGSVFYCALPLQRPTARAMQEYVAATPLDKQPRLLPPQPTPAAVLLLLSNRTLAASLLYTLQPHYRSVLVAKDAADALRIVKERAANQRAQRQQSASQQSQPLPHNHGATSSLSEKSFAAAAADVQWPLCAVILDVGLNGAALNGLDEHGRSSAQSGCGGLAVAASIRQMEAELRAVRVPFLLLRHKRAPATISFNNPAPALTPIIPVMQSSSPPAPAPATATATGGSANADGIAHEDDNEVEESVAEPPCWHTDETDEATSSSASPLDPQHGIVEQEGVRLEPIQAAPRASHPALTLPSLHSSRAGMVPSRRPDSREGFLGDPALPPLASVLPEQSSLASPYAAASSSSPMPYATALSEGHGVNSNDGGSGSAGGFVDDAPLVSAQLDMLWPLLSPCDTIYKPVSNMRLVHQLAALTDAHQQILLSGGADAAAVTSGGAASSSSSAQSSVAPVALSLPSLLGSSAEHMHRSLPGSTNTSPSLHVSSYAATIEAFHVPSSSGAAAATQPNGHVQQSRPSSAAAMLGQSPPCVSPSVSPLDAAAAAAAAATVPVVAGPTESEGQHYRISAAPSDSPPAVSSVVGTGSSVASAPSRPLHILIVEDQLVNQKLLAKMLGKLGYTYEIASNGALAVGAVQRSFGFAVSPPGIEPVDATTAVSAASASTVTTTAMAASTSSSSSSTPRAAASVGRPFDLLLMDVAMPVMDGVTATRAIRQWCAEHRGAVNDALAASAAAAVPSASVTASAAAPPSSPTTSVPVRPSSLIILGLTAHAMVADEERCIAAGMDFVLHKPCSFKDLAAQIHKWTTKTADASCPPFSR
jgi:CheY-like chemotaxis protein/signal transduction histidine kinase